MQKNQPFRLVGAVVVLVVLAGGPLAFAQIVPPDRATVWAPGVPGGVPVRTTQCGATINAAAYGNGTVDTTNVIQTALNNCAAGQFVQLSAGDFRINGTIEITTGVSLRGTGPLLTKLKRSGGSIDRLVVIGNHFKQFTQTVNLASDAAKGSYSVTLASNPGLVVGEIVIVDALANPGITQYGNNCPSGDACRTWFTRKDRPTGQVMEIASVSGTTVTFTTPFHIAFPIAFGAQLSRFSTIPGGAMAPAVKYAGVEDLLLFGGKGGNISISGAAYSWVKNIESDYQIGESIAIDSSFRCEIRDSYFHSTQDPNPGGGGYGISVSFYSADNLFENNIVWNMNKVMVTRASGGGNVFGYNYMDDGWIEYASNFVEVGLNASHMTTPHYELFEGNQSFNFDGDNGWGNSVDITVFRNHLTGQRRSANGLQLVDEGNRRAVGIMTGHYNYTFIGNILGYPGMKPQPASSSFRYENNHVPWDSDPVPMWQLGYNSEDWLADSDPVVLASTIRDGNYDYVTNTVRWDRTPQAIPNSLYLAGKPAFFGSLPWPWVDPTGTTKLNTLPARARFDSLRAGTKFYTVTPCRLADTRNAAGPMGGPALGASQTRDFQVTGLCGIPLEARAAALNVTAILPAATGYMTAFPAGQPRSLSSTVNFTPGKTRANSVIVGLGTSPSVSFSALSMFNGNPAAMHVIVDVVGYFR